METKKQFEEDNSGQAGVEEQVVTTSKSEEATVVITNANNTNNTANTHGTTGTTFGESNSTEKNSTGNDVLSTNVAKVDLGQEAGVEGTPIIEINHLLNLMHLQANDQFDEDERNEEDTLTLNRFNGQPVVVYNMGPEDPYVQATTSEYSKFCHPYINLVYGYKHAENKDLLIIREHVHGKNYYYTSSYDFLGDRLVAFYKCLCLVEYIHSFKAFLRVIRPEKFIMGGGLTCVKLVDVIKHDNRYLTNIQKATLLKET